LLSDQSSLYDTSRSAFESEIDRFRKTLQQLRAENDDLRTSSFEKDKFVADVEAQALRLKQECADHESVAQTAQRTIEELIVDCRRLEDALEDANKRCADRRLLEDRVSQLSSDNERLSSELDRLTRNYHMLSVNLEERDRSRTSLEAEIHSLRSQLHDNMDTHRMADSRMQETVGLLHNAQRELSLEKEVKQSVEGDLRDARAAIALLEAKLMACDEKISVQAQQYSERVSTLEQERDRLGTTVGALTAQLNLSQSSKEGLELTASSLRSDVSALSIQKAELDRLNRQLQHRIEVLISDNDSLQRLRMLIEEARCFDPQFASLGANDILHALVQQWQYSVDLKQEVALLSQELQSLTTDNEAKVGEITRLLSSIEELRDLRRDCETYLSMADAATAQHQKLLGEYRALSDEQDVMQQRIADLEERNMLMLEEKTRTEDELKLAHGEIAELTLQIIKWLRGSGLVQDDAEIVQRLNRQRSVSLLRSQRASSVVHGTDLASE
jgi:chromosome segregation ATPase